MVTIHHSRLLARSHAIPVLKTDYPANKETLTNIAVISSLQGFVASKMEHTFMISSVVFDISDAILQRIWVDGL